MFKGETILGQFELPYIEDSLSYDVVESYLDLTTIKIKVDSNPYIKDCILNKINKQPQIKLKQILFQSRHVHIYKKIQY